MIMPEKPENGASDENPSLAEINGRGQNGRFLPGNQLGKGNPHGVRVARLRSAVMKAVTPEEMRSVIRKLLELALAGDVHAAKVLLDRAIGPVSSVQVGVSGMAQVVIELPAKNDDDYD